MDKELLLLRLSRDDCASTAGSTRDSSRTLQRTASERNLRRRLGVGVLRCSTNSRRVQRQDDSIHSLRPIRQTQLPVRGTSLITPRSGTRYPVPHYLPCRPQNSGQSDFEKRAIGIERSNQQANPDSSDGLCLAAQQLRSTDDSRNRATLPIAPQYGGEPELSRGRRLQPASIVQSLPDQSIQRGQLNNRRRYQAFLSGSQKTECMGGAGLSRSRREIVKSLCRYAIELQIADEGRQRQQSKNCDDGRDTGLLRSQPVLRKAAIALLIAAHNEALVIEHTIRSAIRAGLDREHIYVVDDNSDDGTADIARNVLPCDNVISVERSGKGLAISKAATSFKLVDRYRWIHLADADGGFKEDYFRVLRSKLRVQFAAATGYVKSMQGSAVSQYRAFEYTFGMEVVRRFQNMIGTIPIIPGPTSCFRSDIFEKLEFGSGALAEDFDVTLQIHRQNLGNIQFIEDAVVYTQDPTTIKDFARQIHRWNKGVMQGFIRHKIGTRLTKLDTYLVYQLILSLAMVANYLIILPLTAIDRGVALTLPAVFLLDVGLLWAVVFYTASRSKRWDTLSAFPHIYLLRWVSLAVFIRSFVEVMIFRRHIKSGGGVWQPPVRVRAS